jgi:hypothetical protein
VGNSGRVHRDAGVAVDVTQCHAGNRRAPSTSEAHNRRSEEFHRRPEPASTSPSPQPLTPAHGPLLRCVFLSCCHAAVRTYRQQILRVSQLILPPTQLLPTRNSSLYRKYGSGQVGAHAGVGAHWYVLSQFCMMKLLYIPFLCSIMKQLANACVIRVSRTPPASTTPQSSIPHSAKMSTRNFYDWASEIKQTDHRLYSGS